MKTKALFAASIAMLKVICPEVLGTQVVGISPTPGSFHASPAGPIVVTFDYPIDPGSVDDSSVIVSGEVSGRHPGTLSFASDNTQMTFRPAVRFNAGEKAQIDLTHRITAPDGVPIQPFCAAFNILSGFALAEYGLGTPYDVGPHPMSVVIVDVDRDGHPDIVTADADLDRPATAQTVSVLRNRGDGTFEPKVQSRSEYQICGNALTVAAADLNGDHYPDLLVGFYTTSAGCTNSLAVLLNDGAGRFGPPTIYSLVARPIVVRAADLNGDGKVDVIICGRERLGVLLGNGDGTLGPVQYASGVGFENALWGLQVADLNGDGKPDILVANDFANYTTSATNDGTGHFTAAATFPSQRNTRHLGVGDFNFDGKMDFAVANRNSKSVSVFLGHGNGTFGDPTDYPVRGVPIGLVVGDLDGDGIPDIATTAAFDPEPTPGRFISVLKGLGDGRFRERRDYPIALTDIEPAYIAAEDLDGDGKMELIVPSRCCGTLYVMKTGTAAIEGNVYFDRNGNCARELTDDLGAGGKWLRLTGAGGINQYAVSGANGDYRFEVNAGTYQLSLVHNESTRETCGNGDGIIYPVSVENSDRSVGRDFPTPPCPCSDGAFTISCTAVLKPHCPVACPKLTRKVCPCEQFDYLVTIDNCGPALKNAVVQLTLSGGVTYVTKGLNGTGKCATVTPIYNGGPSPFLCDASLPNPDGTIVWNIGTLDTGTCTFDVVVETDNVYGNHLVAQPSVSGDCPAKGAHITKQGNQWPEDVFCSDDPNDKSVSPIGCGVDGNVPPDEPLTYTVRFQNVGNAPADKVVIRDLLDRNFDLESMKILSTSHTYTGVEVTSTGELVWTFDGINLPASLTDLPGSAGYVQYRIRPKTGLPEGTTILNSAAIYFDYNAPVITATTTNTLRSVPMPDAEFSSAAVSMNAPWTHDFGYTGGTADGASFAWDFGADATPPSSTNQDASGVSYNTEGPKLITLVISRYGCVATNQLVIWVGSCEGVPTLSLRRSNEKVTVSWTDCGILQVAESIHGPWRDVPARTPYPDYINARQRFYRMRK